MPPGDQGEPPLHQPGGERPGIGHDLGRVLAEGGLGGQLQHHRLAGDGVDRAGRPGRPGKTALSTASAMLGAAEDHPAPGSAHGLVGGEGHEVGVGHGAGVDPGGDQAGEVGHVDEQQRPHVGGDVGEGGEVELARVGAVAGDDHPRPDLGGAGTDLVVVDRPVLAVDGVSVEAVELAREVGRASRG